MPEGDTIARTAAVLGRALAGRVVDRFEAALPRAAEIPGRVVAEVAARGKHLLIAFRREGEEDLVLHSHLGMTGSWHVYRAGERWRKPAHRARAVIAAGEFVVPCFSPPVLELLTAGETARHPSLRALGPDLVPDAFDEAEALRRLAARGAEEVGVALMDQTALAGIGNVFKSELLFAERVSPFTRVRDLPPGTLARLVARARALLRANAAGGPRVTRPGGGTWVYGRAGRPCRACGTPIRVRRQGDGGRTTWWCPACQGL